MFTFNTSQNDSRLESQCRELLRYVPDYKGYKSKEWRRSQDKRLRAEISRKLSAGAIRLEAVEKEAFLSGIRASASMIAESRNRLNKISEFMRSVSCGNTHFFEDDILSAARLREVQDADLQIFRMTDSIVRCISKLEQPDLPPDERELRTSYLVDFIDRLCLAFNRRQDMLAGVW
jgi:hypothetical protein